MNWGNLKETEAYNYFIITLFPPFYVGSVGSWPSEPGSASSSGYLGNWLKLGTTERAECFTSGLRTDSHREVIQGVTEK